LIDRFNKRHSPVNNHTIIQTIKQSNNNTIYRYFCPPKTLNIKANVPQDEERKRANIRFRTLDILQALLEDQYTLIRTESQAMEIIKDFVENVMLAHGFHSRVQLLRDCLAQEVCVAIVCSVCACLL
jgi:hypothetical protein